jgi:hypothetical protein
MCLLTSQLSLESPYGSSSYGLLPTNRHMHTRAASLDSSLLYIRMMALRHGDTTSRMGLRPSRLESLCPLNVPRSGG